MLPFPPVLWLPISAFRLPCAPSPPILERQFLGFSRPGPSTCSFFFTSLHLIPHPPHTPSSLGAAFSATRLRSLGFLAPVIIQGKLLLRKIVSETVDWDQPLTDETADEWKSWRDTLIAIETLRIPRTYVPYLSKTAAKELHVFSDASEKAIAAVAYLRTTDSS
ncbi:Hypothetical predicted protein, partial [Mytilus galloprovincialis]